MEGSRNWLGEKQIGREERVWGEGRKLAAKKEGRRGGEEGGGGGGGGGGMEARSRIGSINMRFGAATNYAVILCNTSADSYFICNADTKRNKIQNSE